VGFRIVTPDGAVHAFVVAFFGLSLSSPKIRETQESLPGWRCDHSVMRRRVLVVDDHPSFRRFATKLLQAGGFEVVGEAEDGAAALAAARRLQPELVLLDVLLPDMSGLEVAEALASDSHHLRVVLVSSRSASELGAAPEQSPAAGFLAKSELTAEALAAIADGAP
jgi:DNA-binding NarL/FixJ family response regulator